MVFSSITFLLYFFPLFLATYYFADKKFQNIVALVFSIFFYSWGAPNFVYILLASTFLDFFLVKWMHNATKVSIKKFLLFLSIFLNLGLLAFFKYANFFVENVNFILTSFGATNIEWTSIVLPIGISFYTFQTLTYSIDVYRKVHNPLTNVWDYILYIMMFPQLIAGPIVRFNSIADQITNRNETNTDRLLGFYRFCIGLGKKVLIANVMGAKADLILNSDISLIDTPTAWIGILAYTFQIYFDFSGYSDMAIGIGRMIGFSFPENFNNPYISKSITEFWRRWHMTLGSWMRDYLYIPLGGSKVSKKSRMYFNLWFVFLVSGLWHGASWNFVVWGAYHGFFLILERLFLSNFYKKIGEFPSLIITFFLSIIGWVIFRIENISDAFTYYGKMFAFKSNSQYLFEDIQFNSLFIVAVFFSFITLFKFGLKLEEKLFYSVYNNQLKIWMFFISIMLFILSVSSITISNFNPFIYFRF